MRKNSLATLAALVFFAPSLAFAATQTYSTPGTYTFTVPSYSSLSVDVKGAGGGGGYPVFYWGYAHGYDGTYSEFGSATAVRGNGGGGWWNPYGWPPPAIAGTASGGDINTTGGGSPAGYTNADACVGSDYNDCRGGAGGGAVKSWTSGAGGAPTTGSSVTVVVGTAGAQYSRPPGYPVSVAAGNGSVAITWTEPAVPTCSVTLSPNPINQGSSSTLTWSSTNATSVYIANVGYVSTSGSTSVSPSVTTTYAGSATGAGGSASCTGTQTLTVHPSCSFDGNTVIHGSSVTAYQASTVPYGSTCSSQSRTCTDGTLSGTYQYASCSVSPAASCTLDGTTIAHGSSGTFYSQTSAPSGSTCASISQSRSCTDGTLSGSSSYQYATCSCTPTYSCSGQDIRYTNASCTTSTTLSCTLPAFCSAGSPQCQYPAISFTETTDGTGHLEARPALVLAGDTTSLYWNVANAESCTIAGGGQSWTTTTSGTSGVQTLPIDTPTTYTLTCTAYEGAIPASVTETTTVVVLPVFEEN